MALLAKLVALLSLPPTQQLINTLEQNQREQQKGQTFFVIITVNENKQGIDTHRQENDDAPVSMAILKLYNQEYPN